ncbi:oxoglutarate iron-dependent oxygenase [Trichoderma arundinaceum]|uniref:Oxoglutarate iron-dependent oxygenase n=1 Tax=Trichoderma arundinaceum TaxID=490622 RepID=A0A395NTM4_TRIAR|nr:oxoglutarate iron-dependent oxygenase [Trichoderma arundinaceum]
MPPRFLDPSRSGVQKALLSLLSPTQRQDLNRLGPEQFKTALLEAAGYASRQIPCSIYKPQWPNLKTLALTSGFLSPDAMGKSVNDLFEAAAGAALEMPQLQIMELWNDRFDFGCIFQYQRMGTNNHPTATLSSTWRIVLEQRVSDAWKGVAQKHSNRSIMTMVQTLEMDISYKLHPAIGHLELREKVANPISLRALRSYDGMEVRGRKADDVALIMAMSQ